MITFITDTRSPSEPDILAEHVQDDLVLVEDYYNDTPIAVTRHSAPAGGWTHKWLCERSGDIDCGDAYLVPAGSSFDRSTAHWIGGTEV